MKIEPLGVFAFLLCFSYAIMFFSEGKTEVGILELLLALIQIPFIFK
jgi:hypothetical protein